MVRLMTFRSVRRRRFLQYIFRHRSSTPFVWRSPSLPQNICPHVKGCQSVIVPSFAGGGISRVMGDMSGVDITMSSTHRRRRRESRHFIDNLKTPALRTATRHCAMQAR